MWTSTGPRASGRLRIGVQHGPGVVVGSGILRVRILVEDGELADIVGPVTQGMKFERATNSLGLCRGLHPRERVAAAHTPPLGYRCVGAGGPHSPQLLKQRSCLTRRLVDVLNEFPKMGSLPLQVMDWL